MKEGDTKMCIKPVFHYKSLLSFILFCTIFFFAAGQPVKNQPETGRLSLGMRSTLSTFNQGDFSYNGMGVGGQFRLRLSPRLNSEWYADYITNNFRNKVTRRDGHIGWSLMFYPLYGVLQWPDFMPYLLAGHCFDYTRLIAVGEPNKQGERWSSAVQMGIGTHYNVTPRTDVSLSAQYMMHLGNDLHAEVHDNQVRIIPQKGSNLEAHLLFTLSFNYKLIELW